MTKLIISDVHGNWRVLNKLLRSLGAIDQNGNKNPDFYIVQVGDLMDFGTYADDGDDFRALRMGVKYFDKILCGNHELTPLYGRGFGFTGMRPDSMILPELMQVAQRAVRDGQFVAATEVNGWLITHAGLMRNYQPGLSPDPAEAAEQINDLFVQALMDRDESVIYPMFDASSPMRGGFPDEVGSIFWADAQEMRVAGGGAYKQIVGHTGQVGGPQLWDFWQTSGDVWFIDPGKGRIGALIMHDGDTEWTSLMFGQDRMSSQEQYDVYLKYIFEADDPVEVDLTEDGEDEPVQSFWDTLTDEEIQELMGA